MPLKHAHTMQEAKPAPFTLSNGTSIFGQYWKPEGDVKAVVVQVHGLGEHSGRYAHVGAAFNAKGIALYAYDHTGHGKSDGARGHVPSYEQLLEEIDLAIGKANHLFPGVPVLIYGHSWGGNIALNYLLRRKPNHKGAIITDPWLQLPKEPPAIQVLMGRLMKGILPSFSQSTGLSAAALSHDPAVEQAYIKDPLVHSKISAANYFNTADAAVWALEHAVELQVHTLLMHGGADSITSPEGSKAFAAKAGSSVTLRIWEGMYHEIHNEVRKAEVIEVMGNFLESRL